MAQTHFQTIVVGVGSMGAAACYYLARRGHAVLGIEQFDPPHNRGSHAGQSRIIRKAYFEHPDYVPLLERSYDNWRSFEKETGTRYYHSTGIVYFGSRDDRTIAGIRKSAELYNIPIEHYDRAASANRWPMFRLPSDFEAILESDAGFVTPELAVGAFVREAERLGGTVLRDTVVSSWTPEEGHVQVETSKGTFTAEKLVFTAGAWTSQLVPKLEAKLRVTRQLLVWVRPQEPEAFSVDNFPCWFVEVPELGSFYGFPVLDERTSPGPVGLKLAHHHAGEPSGPDDIGGPVPESELEKLKDFLRTYMPEVGTEIVAQKKCLYTYSPDEDFIIDVLPGYGDRVVIACGFSGHGFKFVPVVGEVLADLAMNGRTDLPAEFLGMARFGST